jgi:hypothetical protein
MTNSNSNETQRRKRISNLAKIVAGVAGVAGVASSFGTIYLAQKIDSDIGTALGTVILCASIYYAIPKREEGDSGGYNQF